MSIQSRMHAECDAKAGNSGRRGGSVELGKSTHTEQKTHG